MKGTVYLYLICVVRRIPGCIDSWSNLMHDYGWFRQIRFTNGACSRDWFSFCCVCVEGSMYVGQIALCSKKVCQLSNLSENWVISMFMDGNMKRFSWIKYCLSNYLSSFFIVSWTNFSLIQKMSKGYLNKSCMVISTSHQTHGQVFQKVQKIWWGECSFEIQENV